jgi:hypothetical protein
MVPRGHILTRKVILDTHLLSHALFLITLGNVFLRDLDHTFWNKLELVGVGRPKLFFLRPYHNGGQG